MTLQHEDGVRRWLSRSYVNWEISQHQFLRRWPREISKLCCREYCLPMKRSIQCPSVRILFSIRPIVAGRIVTVQEKCAPFNVYNKIYTACLKPMHTRNWNNEAIYKQGIVESYQLLLGQLFADRCVFQ